jgi:hypothetical protein
VELPSSAATERDDKPEEKHGEDQCETSVPSDDDRRSVGLDFLSMRLEGNATPACSSNRRRLIRRRELANWTTPCCCSSLALSNDDLVLIDIMVACLYYSSVQRKRRRVWIDIIVLALDDVVDCYGMILSFAEDRRFLRRHAKNTVPKSEEDPTLILQNSYAWY